jgi:hypothetical protein
MITSVFLDPTIALTTAASTDRLTAGSVLNVVISELIAYEERQGFTRLMLTRKRTVDVRESIREIERLVWSRL